MKKEKCSYCAAPMPILMTITTLLKWLVFPIVIGSFVYMVVLSIMIALNKKQKKINSLRHKRHFWTSLVIFASSSVFVFSETITSKLGFSQDISYLLNYVFAFLILIIGFITIKSALHIKISQKYLILVCILVVAFSVAFLWKLHELSNPKETSPEDLKLNANSTNFVYPIGGCGGLSIF